MGKRWSKDTERRTKLYIRMSLIKEGDRDVFKYTRYIKINELRLSGGMRGETFWIKVWDEVNPSKEWIVEFEKKADGIFRVTREEGVFVR